MYTSKSNTADNNVFCVFCHFPEVFNLQWYESFRNIFCLSLSTPPLSLTSMYSPRFQAAACHPARWIWRFHWPGRENNVGFPSFPFRSSLGQMRKYFLMNAPEARDYGNGKDSWTSAVENEQRKKTKQHQKTSLWICGELIICHIIHLLCFER